MTETNTAVDGTTSTEDAVGRWAVDAESEEGYRGGHTGPAVVGRPVSVGHQVKPSTLRLDGARRAKLDDVARARHISASQLVRDLIDAL